MYTNTDFGLKGHILFFMTHQCNDYCKKLKLINPNESKELPVSFSLKDDFEYDSN